MIVYFDRNVLNQIYRGKRGATKNAESALRRAIRHDKTIEPVLSIVTLSEALIMQDVTGTMEAGTLQEIQWIVRLTGRNRVVKDARLLIDESIRAYANNKQPPTPYIRTLDLSKLLRPTRRDIQELLSVAHQYRQQRTDFVQTWMGTLDAMRAEKQSATPPFDRYQKEKPSLKQFWNDIAPPWVERLADRVGVLDKCRVRGMSGLMALKTIRLAVGLPVSLAYAGLFENRAVEGGDFGDIHHVVTAAPADAFVTHDGPLRGLLHCLQIAGLELLTLAGLFHRF